MFGAPQPFCIGENATTTLPPRRSGVNKKFIKFLGSTPSVRAQGSAPTYFSFSTCLFLLFDVTVTLRWRQMVQSHFRTRTR
jgi:hypothetical protein